MPSGVFLGPRGLVAIGPQRYIGLHVIAGCMYSGKSEELIRILSLWKHTGIEVEAYTHVSTVQKEGIYMRSRAGLRFPATMIDTLTSIPLNAESSRQRIIAIDEAHFFPEEEASILNQLSRQALVIVAGLDTDFRGEPFEIMAQALAMADTVTKLTAVCAVCRQPNATLTQRLMESSPAPYDSARFMPGDLELYEPRCRFCHEVPPEFGSDNN